MPTPTPTHRSAPMVIGHSSLAIPRRRRRGGFALLITITLLAFLVLLLVSLASLTRVETQVAANGQQSAQARQNALMALNIALGQLQKYAGPDQRVTARADIDAALANTSTQSGRWLGVYGRAIASADTATRDLYADIPSKIQTDIAANSDADGKQAVLLNWLVSGNENTAFNPSAAIDANGQIPRAQAPSAFPFAHTDAVVLGDATALATNATVKAQPARLLVGPGSASTTSDYVAAPLVSISAEAPGMGSTPVNIGGYAWWVGDENAKARVNLPMAANAQKPQAFVSAQRAAIELVDGVNPAGSSAVFAPAQLIAGAYPPSQANLTNIVAANQLPLLTPGSATALSTAVKHRFHDLTGSSYSILSDTYAGGLKKDLSAVLAPLADTGLAGPLDTDFLFPPEPESPASPTNSFGLPTWGVLRSFAKTRSPLSGGLPPRVPEMTTVSGRPVPVATSMGISPVMTYATLGFQYAAPQGDVLNGPINLAVFPIVVLWNPYTVDIAPARYEFGLRRTYDALIQLQARPSGSTDPWGITNVLETRDLGKAGSTSSSAANSYFRFIIDNSGGIPAGQSLVFTLQTSGQPYAAADTTNMLSADSYNPLGHVLLSSSLTISTPGLIYRVGVNGRATPTAQTLFGYATRNNMGGPDGGWHEAYLGTVGAPVPGGSRPFTGTSTFTSQQFFQQIATTNGPYNTVSPYTAAAGGYPVSTVNTGLIQNENTLSIVTAPTFRIPIRALFSRPERTEYSSRWIAQTNPRALLVGGFPNGSNNGIPDLYTGRPPESGSWPYGLRVHGGGTRAASGSSLLDTTLTDTTLYEFRPASQPLMALGQLQHANLAWQVAYPAYAIGNSLGDPKFASVGANLVFRTTGGSSANDPAKLTTGYYDLAWLANRTLWDRYFVSTVPHAGTGAEGDTELTGVPPVLPNPRHVKLETASEPALRDASQAAAHLMIAGGFNINSTSEQAWRAVLGGMNQLAYDPTGSNAGGSASSDAVISRFSKPTTNGAANGWQGYRKLTAAQIAELAKNIVAQIRKRGPFVSMADFVNRRLVQSGAFPQTDDTRLKGPLQAALDATTSGSAAVNTNTAPFDTLVVNSFYGVPTNPFQTGSAASGAATRSSPVSSTAVFAPQFVTQADILSAIGSGLSARSDTFTVRAYGETTNPALTSSDPGHITGRAWCEAVVQRLPDYVDSTTDPDAHLSPSSPLNKTMGRRFKIVSFRWLTSNDI
jgi:hypothetical protein